MNKTKQINYKISPSMLNDFDWYLNSEDADGEAKLINSINKLHVPTTEPQAKGKAFEYVINCCLQDENICHRLKTECLPSVTACYKDEDGAFSFDFNSKIILDIYDLLRAQNVHSQQVYVSRCIEVKPAVNVELYGYVDYLTPLSVVDLKTTKSYTYPKYLNSWQLLVYGYIMQERVSSVDFVATDFADVYHEIYAVDYVNYNKSKLTNMLQHYINFIESNRHLITNKKVFGQDVESAKHSVCQISFKFSEVV